MARITDRLTRCIANTHLADFPEKAVAIATNLFFDTVGCMLAGVEEKGAKIVETFAVDQGLGNGTIVGSNRTASPFIVALVNGTSAAILDYDDSTWRMIGHPSGCVVPAVLALGEDMQASGAQVLEAYMVGYEAIGNIAKGTAPALYMTGRHTTGAMGIFGAAAGCAKLLGLSPEQIAMALGIAASNSGALRAGHGTMTKGLHSGNAAAQGMMSAILASRGFIAQPDIFDHKYGFFNVSIKSNDYSTDRVGVDWGKPWEFLEPNEGPGIKLFPSGTTSFCAGECALHIAANEKFDPRSIRQITWQTTPLAVDIAPYGVPEDRNQAFYSIGWAIAAGLVDGRLGLRQYDEDKIQDPLLRDVCAKVVISVHPLLKDAKSPEHVAGELSVHLADGRVLSHMRRRPRAYPGGEEVTREQLVEKFAENAGRSIAPQAAEKAMGQLFSLRRVENIRSLMADLRKQ